MSTTEISSTAPTPAVLRNVLVFGAGGLIGHTVTSDLRARGFRVTAIARRFASGVSNAHDLQQDLQIPAVDLTVEALSDIVSKHTADVVVNCLGVLQDGPGASTRDVHLGFVQRLIAAIKLSSRKVLVIHLSVPGDDARDGTAFSKTKRAAEHVLAESGIAFAILRPGFVIAPSAFGGSALMRALAALPLRLSERETSVRFMPVAVEDVAVTVALLAASETEPGDGVVWELMQPEATSLGGVITAFRRWLGAPRPWLPLPSPLLTLGAKLGDLAALLGWSPPVRSTALAELRRGVAGDPSPWIAATGIAPRALADTLQPGAANVQDKWFARLYLTKALMLVSLVVFWVISGLIALTLAFDAARFILLSQGFPAWLATLVTVVSSLVDISIGVLIAFRRTCFVGLVAGILVALGYMVGAAVLTPDLWIEPLGALVKTSPAIVLMIVALLTLDNR